MPEINYKFKKYIPQNKQFTCPAITINEEEMRLNYRCREHIQQKPYYELFYEEDEKIIAIRPIHIDTAFSLKFSNFHSRYDVKMHCPGFLKSNDIASYLRAKLDSPTAKIQIPVVWDDKNKCFYVDLKEHFGQPRKEGG